MAKKRKHHSKKNYWRKRCVRTYKKHLIVDVNGCVDMSFGANRRRNSCYEEVDDNDEGYQEFLAERRAFLSLDEGGSSND